MNKHLLNWIMWLALFGVLISMYSLAHKTGFTSGALCNLNDTFSCDIVNQGRYSEVFGIPVAAIGVVGYAFVFIATVLKRRNLSDRGLSLFLLIASLGGFVFALYLTGIEAFVLRAWCIVCLLSQATIAAIVALTLVMFIREKTV